MSCKYIKIWHRHYSIKAKGALAPLIGNERPLRARVIFDYTAIVPRINELCQVFSGRPGPVEHITKGLSTYRWFDCLFLRLEPVRRLAAYT